ncbi:Uncaracterized surface protein containing fasciclin (FAS1) repeats [Pedococcus dokdonensis]|uniref:Uncaracterized surface protein containing fasciclin (FAS1) repeats n=1 Tax=Pedococcus dokdonensis TaxID=443156 RepID=A0A1H0QX83_9MICO|nr:fasciclin domain-containing protein [Pedococcus dokdonensis]SDP21358.1 Uncaracterized surface protein containing fasciclin (FAS1) repeats [Pedococcus dokdonensis]
MFARRIMTAAATLGLVGSAALVSAPSASAHGWDQSATGTRSLAAVLAKDGSGFDRNWNDFDIVDNAVTAVLTAKPSSPVGVLADGKVALTAFLPTDRAFRNLASDLTGKHYRSESAVFADVASLGIDTVEAVLLYHVVPGATVTYRQALRSDGATLTTASGGTVKVDVKWCWLVSLVDNDPNDRNPYVVKADINKGNAQIAHGISEVLRPLDL